MDRKSSTEPKVAMNMNAMKTPGADHGVLVPGAGVAGQPGGDPGPQRGSGDCGADPGLMQDPDVAVAVIVVRADIVHPHAGGFGTG
jgi:hypothetical protein